jgi:hypothetical protein
LSGYISTLLRKAIRERTGFRWKYCLIPEDASFFPFEPDHIIALKHRSSSELPNLACRCLECNRLKGIDLASIDPETGLIVRLFHPRLVLWSDHFELRGDLIAPRTAIGRATEYLLQSNRPIAVSARRHLLMRGRHSLA